MEIKGGAKISTELGSFSLICNVLRIKKTWSVSYFCPHILAILNKKVIFASQVKFRLCMPTESQNIEFKESWRDEYQKWICGFANAQGGILYVGVKDNGEVCGCRMPRS